MFDVFYLVIEEGVDSVGLSPGVFVHVHAPEVVADGEEERQVVPSHHQHWQHVQHGNKPLTTWEKGQNIFFS